MSPPIWRPSSAPDQQSQWPAGHQQSHWTAACAKGLNDSDDEEYQDDTVANEQAPSPRRATTSPTSPSSAGASSPPARPTPSSSSPPAAPLPPPLLFILIALLLVFIIVAFVVTDRDADSVVSGRGYREYRLGEYSTWLQHWVEDADNWARIRSCLRDGSVCQRFGARGESLQQFVTNNLSPIQVSANVNALLY
ncbi:hypothetical protein ZWY2020_014411 [Hordeum vulgare]|nr:hypothetical protein ZWY2020_014411 [Hordeum vulgare]